MSLNRSSSLREELPKWVDEGLISRELADTLAERYQLNADDPWYKKTSFYISLVAAILVSMGVVLVVSENWDHLPIPARMSVGILPWLAAMGFTVRYHALNQKSIAEAWGFLTSLLLGVNIFLQAQIFHISGYEPDAVLWWMLGVLPLALVLRSHAILFIAQALTVQWIGMETAFDNFNYLVIPVSVVVIVSMRGLVGRLTAVGAVFVLIFMINHVSEGIVTPDRTVYLALLASYGALALALFLSAADLNKGFVTVMTLLSSGFVVFCALIGTTETWNNPELLGAYDSLALIISAVSLGVIVWKTRLVIPIATVALSTLIALGTFLAPSQTTENILTIILNLAMFGGAVWFIQNAVQNTSKLTFMSGLILIVALAITRFGDYFDNYIVGAIVFIIAGIGLVLANMYWNKRYAG